MMNQIQKNKDLTAFNTFGLAVKSANFVEVSQTAELLELLASDFFKNKRHLILGGGSNVLFTGDFPGLVIKLNLKGISVYAEEDNYVVVEAAAGESWHDLVLHCTEKNWGGMENLALIPGSVGAAPMQNIGAYGVEIKDVFHSLEAVHKSSGRVKEFLLDDCKFGYRESIFKHDLKDQYVITKVRFTLTKRVHTFKTAYGAIQQELAGDKPSIQGIRDAVIRIRQSKLPDPKKIGNSGSFFKNPIVSKDIFNEIQRKQPEVAHYVLDNGMIKLAAGWLIDQAGWKGKTMPSGAGVHAKQALVLINHKDATGEAIYALSEEIIQDIYTKYGVLLEREVNIV